MLTAKNLHILKPLLFILNLFFTTSIAQESFCGKIRIQAPFLNSSSTESSSLLHRMIQCKSQKLYFRTSLGLFPVSAINYTTKFLTISHPPCSSSLHYVSPSLLSAGFPSPPLPNSLLLFNCSNKIIHPMSPFIRNCSFFHPCGAFSSQVQKQEQPKLPPSCFLVDDLEKVNVGFDPKHLNCSHYSHIHRSLADDHHSYEGFNCSNKIIHPMSPFIRNCSFFHPCGAFSSQVQKQEQPKLPPSCFLVDDLEKVNVGFDPKHLNCSHYSHIHRSLADDHHSYEGYELGTRISFDIPDHVPNPCDECEKPNGNCGVGLRCICHPNECKNKVISMGGSVDPFGNILSLLALVLVIVNFLIDI